MGAVCKIGIILSIFCFFYSCSPTKYVGKDEYLLDRVRVKVSGHRANRSDIKRNIRQKPNTRILGASRFHLGLYNLSGRNEKRWLNRLLRRIGEAPVIYNPFLTTRSNEQISLYLRNKGFYKNQVKDTVYYKKKKAIVEYRINTGPQTKIDDVSFLQKEERNNKELTGESNLVEMYYQDTLKTLLHKEMPLDMDVLDNERERITRMLREKGYFNFSKNFIQFFADTSSVSRAETAKLFVHIIQTVADSAAFQRYFLRDIHLDFDYDPLLNVGGRDSSVRHMEYDGYKITYRDRLKIKPKVITETIQMERMELYNVQRVLETYSRLQALNLFKFINIDFKEVETDDEVKTLDCYIQLSPVKRQSYNVFLEGTNSSGNLGIGGNFTYNHRNLFKAGENFSVSVWGTLKKEQIDEKGKIFNTKEIGAEIKFVTPQFWMPFFKMKDFRRNFAPKTSISFSYGYEYTPYYTRSVVNARFGYLWRLSNKRWRYNFDLIDLNYVLMKNVNRSFVDSLKNEYIKNTYTDHMIFSAVFSATYTDQIVNSKEMSYNYFRANLESSGNLLWGIDRLFGERRKGENLDDKYYKWLGVRYAQFVKADAEYRYHWYINRANSIVTRLFIGCGYPYGNMKVLPFEESYYCGGASDIRAWQTRTLGPGSYDLGNKYPNSVGDFKLEANIEYRFKLIWLLEGALFVDAGNIWNINPKEDRPGAQLNTELFNQVAIGTGAGLRINANFFLLRFDLGIKVKDPALPAGNRFVMFNSKGGFRRSVFNIAIGYPF